MSPLTHNILTHDQRKKRTLITIETDHCGLTEMYTRDTHPYQEHRSTELRIFGWRNI